MYRPEEIDALPLSDDKKLRLYRQALVLTYSLSKAKSYTITSLHRENTPEQCNFYVCYAMSDSHHSNCSCPFNLTIELQEKIDTVNSI